VSAGADRWIRWTTIGCVALLALIAGTVSYMLVARRARPGWVAALTPSAGLLVLTLRDYGDGRTAISANAQPLVGQSK
jgi:hypothetical protein